MSKVGIIGATGYVGIELLRLLLTHPLVTVEAISSSSFKGEEIASIYKILINKINLICENPENVIEKCDVIFTALPHGLSEKFALKALERKKKIIDLGADFRLDSEKDYQQWYGKNFINSDLHKLSVYGLPELNRKKIKNCSIIANPGCYPTSIALALMPLLKNSLIKTNNVIIDSKSGATGAGRGLSLKSHYPELNENFVPYNIGCHRHTPEIEQTLSSIAGESIEVTFTPHLLPINRGILSTIYCETKNNLSLKSIHQIYDEFYKNEKFLQVLPLNTTAEIKNAKYSNNCQISLHENYRKNKLIIISTIDNMIKGAAGQAIQNLNLILGLNEDCGLNMISPPF